MLVYFYLDRKDEHMTYNGKKTYSELRTIELHTTDDGEWSGLYINGDLDSYGDRYLQDDRCFELLRGVYVENSPWLIDNRTPYNTTAEIEDARAERDDKFERAAQLRLQADALIAEAEALSA